MSINLKILQNFNNAVNSNAALNGNTRLQNGTFKLGGTYDIRQIPSNKYDHAANNAVRKNFAAALTGGIADAVRRLSNADYARLYDEAYAQEVNSPKLLVRDALVHFRHPVQG